MKEFSLDDSIAIAADVVFRDLDGETVMLALNAGTYFGLDEVGSRMWHVIAQYGSLRQGFEILQTEYDVAPEILEQDFLRIARELCVKGLATATPASR